MILCKDCGLSKSRKGLYCKKCGYKYRIRPSGLSYIIKVVNRGWFKKGAIPWVANKQLKPLEDYSAEYSNLHKWLRRHWGAPVKCEFCGSGVRVQWANKSNKYERIREDWLHLCMKCHARYDFENFGARKRFYNR